MNRAAKNILKIATIKSYAFPKDTMFIIHSFRIMENKVFKSLIQYNFSIYSAKIPFPCVFLSVFMRKSLCKKIL